MCGLNLLVICRLKHWLTHQQNLARLKKEHVAKLSVAIVPHSKIPFYVFSWLLHFTFGFHTMQLYGTWPCLWQFSTEPVSKHFFDYTGNHGLVCLEYFHNLATLIKLISFRIHNQQFGLGSHSLLDWLNAFRSRQQIINQIHVTSQHVSDIFSMHISDLKLAVIWLYGCQPSFKI